MRIHDRQQQRYRCRSCGHTFSARRGTMLEGLREPTRDRKLADRLLHLHHELSKVTHQDFACTPAMASGLTDHIWSVEEVLTYKVAPAPWVEPRRRGRPRKHPFPDSTVPKRPRGRPRKVA